MIIPLLPSYGSQQIERSQIKIDAEVNGMRSFGARAFKRAKAKRKAAKASRRRNRH